MTRYLAFATMFFLICRTSHSSHKQLDVVKFSERVLGTFMAQHGFSTESLAQTEEYVHRLEEGIGMSSEQKPKSAGEQLLDIVTRGNVELSSRENSPSHRGWKDTSSGSVPYEEYQSLSEEHAKLMNEKFYLSCFVIQLQDQISNQQRKIEEQQNLYDLVDENEKLRERVKELERQIQDGAQSRQMLESGYQHLMHHLHEVWRKEHERMDKEATTKKH